MATSEIVRRPYVEREAAFPRQLSAPAFAASQVMGILASLRLTVALFALSLFLIFMGSLAQKDHDVWEVVNSLYFNCWAVLIEFRAFERLAQIFFKNVDWKLTGGFYFPGGKIIGLALLVNLTAAHAVRFKVAAEGRRLAIGVTVIVAGLVLTYGAIQSGMNQAVETRLSSDFCNLLWQYFRGSLAVATIAGAYGVLFMRDRLRSLEWTILLVTDVLLAVLTVYLLANPAARLDDSGIRILWQLMKGGSAGLVLLVGCIMVFRKRAGIVLLHAGIALMMIGQLLTSVGAVESRMSIPEGGTVGFSDDIRSYELAVIDHSPAEHDHVTVVPSSLLTANVGKDQPISHDELPFNIRVHQWLQNSQLRDPKSGESNAATAGIGLQHIAEPVSAMTGVGEDAAKVDYPSAYVELISKKEGKSLGTYLTSLRFFNDQSQVIEQPIEVDGKRYDLALRFKRIYHPFTLTLKEFSFDRYLGTNTPKNYSSLVEFKEPSQNIEREVLIWMNNPLRYEGTTFYQQSFDEATEKATVLQVVSNPSWMTPYVACMLVAIGMLAHFGLILVRFLRRRADEVTEHPDHYHESSAFARWFPALILIIFAGYLIGKARLPNSPSSEMQVHAFGKLPVAYQGRIKPYDTLARNSLQIISGRQEVGLFNEKGKVVKKLPAIVWLIDVISGAKAADDHRVFRIDNPDIVKSLGLENRPMFWRYSLNEIQQKPGELNRQITRAQDTPEDKQQLYHKKVLQLRDKYNFYTALVLSFRSPPLSMESREKFTESVQKTQFLINQLERVQAPHAVPPNDATANWSMLVEAEYDALLARASQRPVNPATLSLSKLLGAYAAGDTAKFNQQLTDYRRDLTNYETMLAANPAQLKESGAARAEILSQKKIDFEVFFNQFSPFYYAAVLYLFAFVLGAFSWVGWTEPLRRASMWLLWLTFGLHTLAIIARIYISGRPPITNLYSTAIFIGWAGVLLALVFEKIYRLGLGNIVAATIGFLTLLVAYNLSLDGDTFIVLQAVLDTQFWLATHVVTMNLGYAATYLAGLWGAMYILLTYVFPAIDAEGRNKLLRALYGTLCFAIFFTFIGTVLGGLWADDSWGRFWGWDPKENGALMIVIWNALVLHARWGGLVKGRGLANLAVFGNIMTTWSYFGVNELGVGLHAYGAFDTSGAAHLFKSPTAMWLFIFIASQLAILMLGLIPSRWLEPLRLSRAPT